MKILSVAKGQKRSILEVCEHFDICSKVQNLQTERLKIGGDCEKFERCKATNPQHSKPM